MSDMVSQAAYGFTTDLCVAPPPNRQCRDELRETRRRAAEDLFAPLSPRRPALSASPEQC